MFADSLRDSAWTNRSHRGGTTLASFAAQGLGVAVLAGVSIEEATESQVLS